MGDILCSFDRMSDSRQLGAGILAKRHCWDDAEASPATSRMFVIGLPRQIAAP
jgi:hypothetical protein